MDVEDYQADLIVQVLGPRDNLPQPTPHYIVEHRSVIAARYAELRGAMDFQTAERTAKREWLRAYIKREIRK